MELRRLQASDLFSMVKILNGIGLKNVKDAINQEDINEARKKAKEATEKGLDITDIAGEVGTSIIMSVFGVVMENLPNVEKDLYNFMGSVANMKPSEVAKMDIADFMNLIIEIVKKEEFADFFKQASKLIK